MAATATPDLDGVVTLVGRISDAIARRDATALDVARVAGIDISDDGAPLAVTARADVAGVEQVSVTRQWGGEVPNAAAITLAPGLDLRELEAHLGTARPLPSVRPGEQLVVLGGDDGDATTLAAADANGGVRSITVRRENGPG
jgi:hypothetical protein